ncbi:MAG: FAD-dependent oxidoreductase [Pirellulaceae bacterium]
MLNGAVFHGKMFVDATYEGDLMAAAGVDYHVGREANSGYNEKWNGNQVGVLHHALL